MTIPGIRTNNPMWQRYLVAEFRPEPPASVRAQRPPFAPSVGTSFGNEENFDAQNAWLAHIEAGRIEVK